MASPATGDAPNGITTPTNPNAGGQGTPPSSSAAPANNATNNNATTPTDGAAAGGASITANNTGTVAQTAAAPPPAQPPTSISDTGLSKRPKDARLIHMVLAHQGVQAYQERVPLQLLDFAYRYTAGVLSDAVSINAETAPTATTTGKGGGAAAAPPAQQEGSVSLGAVRSAIASRLNYQFNPTLPKEFLLELAAEKNRVGLPKPEREYGARLPPERYCFTGAGWNLKEEWESEIEEDEAADGDGDVDMGGQQQQQGAGGEGVNGGGDRMEGVQMGAGQQEGEDEDEQDEFEEVMGVGSGGGGGGGSSGGDSQMMDA